MQSGKVELTLNILKKVYRRILEDSAPRILEEAIQSVKISHNRYSSMRNRPHHEDLTWGYEITHDHPLRFKASNIMKGVEPQVDVYCSIQWQDEDIPVTQDIKIRIWSDHDQVSFREDFDSAIIEAKLLDPERQQRGRVISRLHFDKATYPPDTSLEYHPAHHIQIGGKPEEYELCWHPKSFDLPRIGYQPMELLLTCQFIAINFFPGEYAEIRKEAEWRGLVNHYQKSLLLNYYQSCIDVIEKGESLFDLLDVRRQIDRS